MLVRKTQFQRRQLKITSTKIQILPQHFFPEWFGPKQIEAIRFRNEFHDKSAQTDCSKEIWIPISKRLKHLNLDLAYCNLAMFTIIVK